MNIKLTRFAAGLMLSVALVAPLSASAALTLDQISAIVSLLQSFGADSTAIAKVQMVLGGGSSAPVAQSCPGLSRSLTLGSRGDDVLRLQKHLTDKGFFTANATGYYGFLTAQAVGKLQISLGVVSSPDDSAYGILGPKTLAALGCGGGDTMPGPVPVRPYVPPTTTMPITVLRPTCALTAKPYMPAVGETTTLSWTSKNANYSVWRQDSSANVLGLVLGKQDASGSLTITIGGGKEVEPTLLVYGSDGSIGSCSTHLRIEPVAILAPVINSFSASASTVSSGEPVALSWSSNAANCSILKQESTGTTMIDPQLGSATTHTVYPTVTTTYQLQCLGPDPGTGKDGPAAFKSLTVSVSTSTDVY